MLFATGTSCLGVFAFARKASLSSATCEIRTRLPSALPPMRSSSPSLTPPGSDLEIVWVNPSADTIITPASLPLCSLGNPVVRYNLSRLPRCDELECNVCGATGEDLRSYPAEDDGPVVKFEVCIP